MNQDGANELWLKINPLTGPAGGAKEHYVYVFQDCELQVMNNPEGTLNLQGNTVSGETFYIDCVIENDCRCISRGLPDSEPGDLYGRMFPQRYG